MFLGDGSGFGETLDLGSESLGAPTAGPAAPSAPGGCRQPPGTMKEKGVHPKRVKVMPGRGGHGAGSGASRRPG